MYKIIEKCIKRVRYVKFTWLFCNGVSLLQTTASQDIAIDLNCAAWFFSAVAILYPSTNNPYCLLGSSFILRLESYENQIEKNMDWSSDDYKKQSNYTYSKSISLSEQTWSEIISKNLSISVPLLNWPQRNAIFSAVSALSPVSTHT